VTRETVAYFRLTGGPGLPSLIESTSAVHEGYALEAPGVGLKAGVHNTGVPADPDEPGGPNEAAVRQIEEWVAQRLPVESAKSVSAEKCLYTNTPDEHFIEDRQDRIVVGSACSGRGFKCATRTGRVLADLASELL